MSHQTRRWLWGLELFPGRLSRPRRRTSRTFWNVGEELEVRALLSGNVTVSTVAGVTQVRGDAQNNQIQIGVVDGDLVVRGLQGTTINGQSQFVLKADATALDSDLDLQMGGGADTVLVTTGVTINGDVTFKDLDGLSELSFNGATIAGDLNVQTGAANDVISFESTTIEGDVQLETNAGADRVLLLETTIEGEFSAETGRGEDDIVIDESEFQGDVSLSTGRGQDGILIRNSLLKENLFISAGSSDDFVMGDGITVEGDTVVLLLRGNDTVVVDGESRFEGNVFSGGLLGRKDAASVSKETEFEGRVRAPGFERHTVKASFIDDQLNDSDDGLLTLADAARERFAGLLPASPAPSLTATATQNNTTVQGNGTIITKETKVTITGTTGAGATVRVDSDNDGQYGDGTVTADPNGSYTIDVNVQAGAQTLKIKASNSSGDSPVREINVHRALGTVVQFATAMGNFEVELLDDDAPLTVSNFLEYLDRYEDSIVHRTTTLATAGVNVIQGGGFILQNGEIEPIDTDSPIANEFDNANSNVRGTLSMALPAGSPNGGTSQWFVNVTNNTALDGDLHTVFGRVIGAGMTVVEAIHNLPRFNLNPLYEDDNQALSTVPLQGALPTSRQLPGTVSVAAGSTTVTGVGTNFTSSLEVGSRVRIGTFETTVASISSNTSLTLTAAPSTASTGVPLFTQRKATASDLVLFTGVNELLPA